MPAGLQITNSLGDIQFDAESHAYGFVGKGSFAATDHWDGAPYAIGSNFNGTYGSVQVDYDFDLVFFRCADAFILPVNRRLPGDSARTIRALSIYCWNNAPSSLKNQWQPGETTGLASHMIQYWAFRSMKSLVSPQQGVGLRTWNENGDLVYDTNLRPVEVVSDNRVTATSYAERSQLLPSADVALMKYGTTADPRATSSTTIWNNVAVRTTPTDYRFRSFANPLRHTSAAGNQPGIYTGGFIGVDTAGF